MTTITRKFMMAFSGLALVGFVVAHLAGNLSLLLPGGAPFNAYAKKLHDLGPLLIAAEIGLVLFALVHIVSAIQLKLLAKSARPIAYAEKRTKGRPSKAGWSANTMIFSGVILLAFLILHIWQFKFGPSIEEGYTVEIQGETARDLYRLVVETFQNPLWAGLYGVVMVLLGLHLRHGFWSAFQSLGLLFPKYTKIIYTLGLLIALLFAGGFLLIPLWIYFDLGRFFT